MSPKCRQRRHNNIKTTLTFSSVLFFSSLWYNQSHQLHKQDNNEFKTTNWELFSKMIQIIEKNRTEQNRKLEEKENKPIHWKKTVILKNVLKQTDTHDERYETESYALKMYN